MISAVGHAVEVFERAATPGPVGAGFLLQPVGLAVLWELGLLDAALRHGAPVTRLYGETVSGRPVMDMRYADLAPGLCGLGLQRGALFELLDGAWRDGRTLHAGHAIASVDAERGTLVDDAGTRHGPFDLVVVADGAASKLRAQIAPSRLDRPYPGRCRGLAVGRRAAAALRRGAADGGHAAGRHAAGRCRREAQFLLERAVRGTGPRRRRCRALARGRRAGLA